ncbi:hypothetical protein YC2023_071558 [Brassica napus]
MTASLSKLLLMPPCFGCRSGPDPQTKLHQSVLRSGYWTRPFDFRNSVVFSQFDENPGKAVFSDSNVKVRKGEKLALTCFVVRGGGYVQRAVCKISGNDYLCSFSGLNSPTAHFNRLLGLISPFLYGKQKERTREELRERKRELLIFGWIDQVRVKNDRLWGDSDCLNVRRSDGNRSRGVRRDRIKQNIPTLRQR